jgi:hypothetical protein
MLLFLEISFATGLRIMVVKEPHTPLRYIFSNLSHDTKRPDIPAVKALPSSPEASKHRRQLKGMNKTLLGSVLNYEYLMFRM